jgi:hypothetical protein
MTARIDSGEPFLKYLNVSKTPYIFLTGETDDFDEETIAAWEAEGFVTIYVPYRDGGHEYVGRMHAAPDQELGLNDQYAIVGMFSCLYPIFTRIVADRLSSQHTEMQQVHASKPMSSQPPV